MRDLQRNPQLFPPFVAQHTVTFDKDDPNFAAHFPGVALPESLNRAVRKRQAEFLAGRFCAREALRTVLREQPERADAPIGSGKNREPLWPDGVVGAITHTNSYASVAIARASDAQGIGLDAENVMTDDHAEDLLDKIAVPAEIAAMKQAMGWGTGVALTLAFSAKESVFKCLYPQVQRYFGFHDAWIDVVAPGRFTARLCVTLTPSLPAGRVFEGRFEQDAAFVCTGMLLAPA